MDRVAAHRILLQDAEQIIQLIRKQQEHLCLGHCPAFETVVDTQLFAFSKQVGYAVAIGVLSESAGQRLLSDLEWTLYTGAPVTLQQPTEELYETD